MHRVDLLKESTEYVRVQVSGRENGLIHNPTEGGVEMAFMGSGRSPAAEDWHEAEWESDSGTYFARVLVGPESAVGELDPDTYTVWVKFEAAPEVPVKAVSRLYVE